MRLRTLIWKELWQRPPPMLTSVLAVTLGVTVRVAIRITTVFSEQKIAGDVESLGANVLVLPPAAMMQEYYSADMHGDTMPEESCNGWRWLDCLALRTWHRKCA